MSDMREVYSEKQKYLENALGEVELTPEQKELIKNAMEFGYAAAYCARTNDMNGSFYQAERYEDGYNLMKKKIE
jgi:hypothetical protein